MKSTKFYPYRKWYLLKTSLYFAAISIWFGKACFVCFFFVGNCPLKGSWQPMRYSDDWETLFANPKFPFSLNYKKSTCSLCVHQFPSNEVIRSQVTFDFVSGENGGTYFFLLHHQHYLQWPVRTLTISIAACSHVVSVPLVLKVISCLLASEVGIIDPIMPMHVNLCRYPMHLTFFLPLATKPLPRRCDYRRTTSEDLGDLIPNFPRNYG